MPEHIIPASRKRIVLAIYLDFVLFSALLTLGLYLTTGRLEVPTWEEFIGFSVYEAILYGVTDPPGFYLLGIRKAERTMNTEGQPPVAIDTLLVDPQVYFHENWLTILIGVLCVLEGSKQLVRWAMWTPPLPIFGLPTNQGSFATYSIVLGGMLIYTGYTFLRLKQVGFWLGLCIAASTAASAVMSWNQWDSIAQEMVIRRRTFQGLPVRVGEVEFMQSILPEALVASLLLSVVAMIFARKRLRY